MDVVKASGETEAFSERKLHGSLKKAGVNRELVEKISGEIAEGIHTGASTEEIFDKTISRLRKENWLWAARYNLKRAIMELGPAGFAFERYVAEIFKNYGYKIKVGQKVQGACVDHEIDVVAEKENKRFMIECKYHNSRGLRSDVKVALYTYARFLDIKKRFFQEPWLVTNTKCTSQAIGYARCAGLKIIGWHYPANGSLEYLIEQKGLYPITILPSLTRYARERLAEKNLVLARDLLKYSTDGLIRLTGLWPKVIEKLQEEVRQLCHC